MSQIKFLGATVSTLNTNLGWGDSPSTCTITLAEDIGDSFTFPQVGSPVVFVVGDWYFGGLIQNWTKKIDSQGNPLYDVILIDPRELLDGIQIILGGYSRNITVPNLFNINGYLQTKGIYRGSSGFAANIIKSAFIDLSNAVNTDYGSRINLNGNEFKINLDALPKLPDYYKISQESISVLEFVKQICDDMNHDYFFSMVPGIYPTITLNVLNRNAQPVFGAIANYLSNQLGATNHAGYEFTNQYTSKFLLGGRIAKMYFQTYDGGSDRDPETDPWENSLWQYWGIDQNKNAIIGDGLWDDHSFEYDIDFLDLPELGSKYVIDVGEIRAALDSQDSWESYLSLRDQNRYKIYYPNKNELDDQDTDSGKPPKDSFKEANFVYPKRPFNKLVRIHQKKKDEFGNIYIEDSEDYKKAKEYVDKSPNTYEFVELKYYHKDEINYHFGKATALNITGSNCQFIGAFLYHNIEINPHNSINGSQLKSLFNFNKKLSVDNLTQEQIAYEIIEHKKYKLYTFIRGIAEQYYGKTFMIRLPFIISNRDDDNEIYSSYEPTDLGYIEEEEYPVAWKNNLLPIPFNGSYAADPHISAEDGRLYAYVRFDSVENLDYSDIPPENIIISAQFDSVFIRCEVEEKLVYQNENLLYSPRAIIKLPGRVLYKPDDEKYFGFHTIASWLYPHISKKTDDQTAKDKLIELTKEQAGADNLNLWMGRYAFSPRLAAVPLLSQDRYGPWYAQGSQGKTEFEEDDSLVPWNFNNWEELNNTAQSKVLNSITNYQINEYGSISIPGLPNILLGNALIQGGPSVTNISVNAAGDFTTTYNMSSWPVNPYKLSKQRNDYISRLNKKQKDIKRDFLQQQSKKTTVQAGDLKLIKTIADIKKKAALGKHSSHDIIFGEKINNDYNVVIQPMYNTLEQINDNNYEKQAITSLNSIFFPFSVKSGELPYLDFTTSGDITTSGLNPLREGSYHTILSSSGKMNTQDLDFNWDLANGIAFRTPAVWTGWGYDLDGKPVPCSGLTLEQRNTLSPSELRKEEEKAKNTFHQDYLNPKTWLTAPFDMRWDSQRNVWSCTTGNDKIVQIMDSVPSGQVKFDRYFSEYSGVLFPYSDRYWPRYGQLRFDPINSHSGGLIYYCREWDLSYQSKEIGARVILTPKDNYLLCGTLKLFHLEPSGLWIAKYFNGKYLIDQQSMFSDATFGSN